MALFQKKQQQQAVDPRAAERLAEQVETVHAVLRRYASGMTLSFGAPTRCPACGDYGFVESVNKLDGVTFNHCFGCQADWVISRAALRAVAADAPAVAAAPVEVPATVSLATAALPARPVGVPGTETAPQDEPAAALAAPAASVEAAPAPPAEATPAAQPASPPEPVEPASPARAIPEPVVRSAPDGLFGRTAEDLVARARAARAEQAATASANAAASPAAAPSKPGQVLRVLVIEDNPFDLAVLEELVEQLDPPAMAMVSAATRAEGEQLARTTEHDLVLLDLSLPDSSGIATLLEWQHAMVSSAPVIILSGTGDPEVIKESRALGVAHFIQKEQLSELADAGAAGSQRLLRLLRSTAKRAATGTRAP